MATKIKKWNIAKKQYKKWLTVLYLGARTNQGGTLMSDGLGFKCFNNSWPPKNQLCPMVKGWDHATGSLPETNFHLHVLRKAMKFKINFVISMLRIWTLLKRNWLILWNWFKLSHVNL